jgi:hypothetical protein
MIVFWLAWLSSSNPHDVPEKSGGPWGITLPVGLQLLHPAWPICGQGFSE